MTDKFGFYDAFGKQLGCNGKMRINDPEFENRRQERDDLLPQKRNYKNEDPVYLNDQLYYGKHRSRN